jgi:vacuolar-type H+-ATPase subunit I/STV1
MLIGLVLKLLNQIHFRHYSRILFECIPEFLFLFCIFGYLCIIIFIKWYTDFAETGGIAPSLITLLIGFFLSPGAIPAGTALFAGQVHHHPSRLAASVAHIFSQTGHVAIRSPDRHVAVSAHHATRHTAHDLRSSARCR